MECDVIAILREGYVNSLGLTGSRGYFSVYLDFYIHTVKCREVGEQAYVTAVYRRCVQGVEGKESSVVILSEPDLSARGELTCNDGSGVDGVDRIRDILLKEEVARSLICLKHGVREVKDVAASEESGIISLLELVRCIFVTAEMRVSTVEIRLVNLCEYLSVCLYLVCARVGEKRRGDVAKITLDIVEVGRRGLELVDSKPIKYTLIARNDCAAIFCELAEADLIIF